MGPLPLINLESLQEVISGTGIVNLDSNGSIIFAEANIYSGNTTIKAGTLQGNVSPASALTLEETTYSLGGENQEVTTLTGYSIVELGGNS